MRAEDKYETERNAARVQQEVKKTDRCETLEVKPVSVWEMCAGFSPCVCFRCEDALHESFRWHPFHRQHGTPTLPVIARPEHTHTHLWGTCLHNRVVNNRSDTVLKKKKGENFSNPAINSVFFGSFIGALIWSLFQPSYMLLCETF